jgi:hypothetical protein
MQAKGFVKPIRNYKVLDQFDELVCLTRIIREERDGMRVFLDLEKLNKTAARETLESILSRLRS